jgi:hypothetical protein
MLAEALYKTNLTNQSMQLPNKLNDSLKAPLDAAGIDLNQLLLECYKVTDDDQRMRKALKGGDTVVSFDQLRKTYPQRREYSHFKVSADLPIYSQLKLLGFSAA